ncbi:MAG: transposase [Lentimonas sp.]|jgi:transposase
MNTVERKQYIIAQIESGRTQVDLAQEFGVSRQAISALWKKYQARGDEVLEANGPGRLKEDDVLTPQEIDTIGDWLHGHDPAEVGFDDVDWTLASVKRAVRIQLGKRLRMPAIYALCEQVFGEMDEAPEAQQVIAKGMFIPSAADSAGFPSLEEMERSNRETLAKMEQAGSVEFSAMHSGERSGKRAKANHSPVAKKKRRKKR